MSLKVFEDPFYYDETIGIDGNQTAGSLNDTGDVVSGTSLTDREMLVISLVGFLGFAGILMNTGVLVVVYHGRLVKSDYRMLYYIFMTCGDLMFALHTFINACSILFKDFYVFKIFAVCLNIQLTLGVTSYQWSAICIILLIVDLTWSIKYPFSQNKNKKLFSKIGCIGTFFLGIALTLVPFIYWNDSPSHLPFCSIGNVYGVHWDFYQQEAVSFLTVLLLSMILACLNLLLSIYRTNTAKVKLNTGIAHAAQQETACHSPHPRIKDRVNPNTSSPTDQAIITIYGNNAVSDNSKKVGVDNLGFASEEKSNDVNGQSSSKQDTGSRQDLEQNDHSETGDHLTQAAAKRERFNRACQTVAFFVASYVGCCLPYYVLMCTHLGCKQHCTEDTPETRRTRAIVATALYLLPIIDPILYTKRFQLFKETLSGIFQGLRNCCIRS